MPLRLQLSTGSVVRLTLRTNDSILVVRQHVAAMADVNVGGVRLFFAGKQLTDNTRLKDAGLRKNYTVQAVLSEARLSKTSLKRDAASAVASELPAFTKESCSKVKSTLHSSTEVSTEQVGILIAAVPTTGLVDNIEQTGMSTALVASTGCGLSAEQAGTSSAVLPSTESEVSTVDLPSSSALPKDDESSSCGLDTAF